MPIHILLPVAALLAASLPASFQEPLDPFQALEERGSAETFLAMMEATGLRAELAAGGSPFTLLAPVDSAFSGISPEVVARLLGLEQRPALRGLLNDHVL
ncbi:MAG: putative surface protein with fasciclin (FAS1) repeats, partial [Planctomycetota bacterium]